MQDLKRFEHFRFVLQIGIDQAYQSKKACNQRTIQFSAGISLDLVTELERSDEFVPCGPSNLLRIAGLPLMCMGFFSLAGGHWLVLQTVACAQMLRDYSKNAPTAEAIQRTFSGASPCTMCKMIAEEQQKEEKAPATVKLDKMTEFFSSSARHLLRKPESKDYFYLPSGERTLSERFEAPPVPIPIA
jgi:hypothetical protein